MISSKKEATVINLLYNFTIRAGRPGPIIIGDITPFNEHNPLEVGKTYMERSGWPCTIMEEIDPDRGEYEWGYKFFGSNGVWYKENGKTSFDDNDTGLNDLAYESEIRDTP